MVVPAEAVEFNPLLSFETAEKGVVHIFLYQGDDKDDHGQDGDHAEEAGEVFFFIFQVFDRDDEEKWEKVIDNVSGLEVFRPPVVEDGKEVKEEQERRFPGYFDPSVVYVKEVEQVEDGDTEIEAKGVHVQ